MEVVSHTNEDLIGPTLHDHIDAVSKRLRMLKLQDPTASLYIFSWLSGAVFHLSDLSDLTLSWGCLPKNRHSPLPGQLSSHVDPFVSIVGAGTKHLRLNIETSELDVNFNVKVSKTAFLGSHLCSYAPRAFHLSESVEQLYNARNPQRRLNKSLYQQ